jgi:hypothetical protein
MYRKFPYREPHVLQGATPAGAAKALDRLASKAALLAVVALHHDGDAFDDRADVIRSAVNLVYLRTTWLASDLVAPMSVSLTRGTVARTSSSAVPWVLLVRGWRRRFPGLLGR